MPTLSQLAEKTRQRYRPANRKPEPDWVRKELSASKLVKETAALYAYTRRGYSYLKEA